MMSIGVLGFVVWSRIVVALFYREVEVINFAVCWNSLKSMSTFYSKNLIGYAESAGNLSLLVETSVSNKQRQVSLKRTSETKREASLNF